MRRIPFHFVDQPERGVDGAGLVHQQADSEVHLQEGEAHLHAFFQRFAHGVAVIVLPVRVRIAIDADAVAKLAAQHLPERNAPGFSGEVPERDFNTRDTAPLPGRTAELFYLVEQPVNIAGVFAEEAALQHQGVCLAGGVSHLPVSDKALICINLQ